MKKYDLIVIGSGPGGEKAAVKAAYFLHKVALIEKSPIFGGATTLYALPTKTLKETALFVSGKYEKGLYGIDRSFEDEPTADNFMYRKNLLMKAYSKAVYDNIVQHDIDIYPGVASFIDPHHIQVLKDDQVEIIYGENILIATGVSSVTPDHIPIDGKRIHLTESILNIDRMPKSIVILGAGVIGCEFATIFSTLNVKVYLINRGSVVLSFFDQEIIHNLLDRMREDGVEVLLNNTIMSVNVPDNERELLQVQLEDGKIIESDMILVATSRKSVIEELCCANAGIDIAKNGLINVDNRFKTNVPHIYAVGDVIGFPSLANVSMDQGRSAVSDMFNMDDMKGFSISDLAYGIYTIPEIASVGLSEEKAKELGIDYLIGRAYHSDTVRGIIMGAKNGMLKIVFDKKSQVVLGVSIIGHLASELIHYGVELVQDKKTITDMVTKSYNFPSLHELYKYAAFDGLSTLYGRRKKKHIEFEE